MKRHIAAAVMAVIAAGASPRAHAWEPDTHVGLTETAAYASVVHANLIASHGRRLGWYEPLAVPRAEAHTLYEALAKIAPQAGAVPDLRGSQTAIAWLIAGTILEGMPAERGRNHYYDPVHQTGLTGHDGGSVFGARFWGLMLGESLAQSGVPAPSWIVAKENSFSLPRFWDELEKSVTAPEAAERDQHLAQALLCAGGMLHVLEDMGVPAHTRDDLAESLSPLGGGPADRGSRFERLVELLDGRLGIPNPRPPVRLAHARDYFTDAAHTGLADVTAARWYSLGSLPAEIVVPPSPRSTDVAKLVTSAQRFAEPHPRDLDLARAKDGAILRDSAGDCLANYRFRDGKLGWYFTDECLAQQASAILPVVGGYARGYLDWLFRGALNVTIDGPTVIVTPGLVKLGTGKVTVLAETAQGKRVFAGEGNPGAGAPELARITLPTHEALSAWSRCSTAATTMPRRGSGRHRRGRHLFVAPAGQRACRRTGKRSLGRSGERAVDPGERPRQPSLTAATPEIRYLARRGVLDDLAVLHHPHAPRDVFGELSLVGHDEHRHAVAGELAHHGEHLVAHLWIERRGRLVEQHDLWLLREDPRDRHALLLAAR